VFAGVLAGAFVQGDTASPAVVWVVPEPPTDTTTPSPESIRELLDELEFKQAEDAARQALAAVAAQGGALGPEDSRVAWALVNVGGLHLESCEFAKARAALSVLRERRSRGESAHPFFWAPFVAAGAWQ
jgi:hypothetical protein